MITVKILDSTTTTNEERASFTAESASTSSTGVFLIFSTKIERKLAIGELGELEIEYTRNEDGTLSIEHDALGDFMLHTSATK